MAETDYLDLAKQLFEAADRECPNWRDLPVLAIAMRRIELDLTFAAKNPNSVVPTTLDDLDALKRALAAHDGSEHPH